MGCRCWTAGVLYTLGGYSEGGGACRTKGNRGSKRDRGDKEIVGALGAQRGSGGGRLRPGRRVPGCGAGAEMPWRARRIGGSLVPGSLDVRGGGGVQENFFLQVFFHKGSIASGCSA